jgi:hypothetical protein
MVPTPERTPVPKNSDASYVVHRVIPFVTVKSWRNPV